jgi:hypothetical protein
MGQLSLLPDLPAAEPPMPEVYGDAHVDGNYRWWLLRWWRAGPHVCWIMLNPSTADDRKNDPTMREVIYFTRLWGYAGLTVVNLYPFRSPNPAACRRWADWTNNGPDYYARDALMRNLDIVAERAREATLVVVAWGATAWDDDWIEHLVEEVQSVEPFPTLHCLGRSASGAPKHPMARGHHRIPRDQAPEIWRAGKTAVCYPPV